MVEDQSNFYQSRAKWTANSTKIFANLLVEQIQQGNRPNNVFNKKAWKHIQEEFNKQTGLKFDRQQLKNHLDVLRKRYNYVKVLLDQNEFSWDVSQCMVIAEDAVWKKYIEVDFLPVEGISLFFVLNCDIKILRLLISIIYRPILRLKPSERRDVLFMNSYAPYFRILKLMENVLYPIQEK